MTIINKTTKLLVQLESSRGRNIGNHKGKSMSGKTPVSNAQTYREIGALWDEHDSTGEGEQKEVEFNVNIESQRRYYRLPTINKKNT